jgi:biotin transport system substrate-specific component
MQKLNSMVLSHEDFLKNENIITRAIKIVLFVSLTIVGSKFVIPTQPVPFTLQTLFVLLSGAFLGKKDGFIAQSVYLLIGAIGLPVFAGPVAGIAKLFGPTGGYLLAFPIAAFITGYFFNKESSLFSLLGTTLLATFTIYFFGIMQLNTLYLHNINNAILSGLAIFSVWEIVKMLAAVFIYKKLL